MKEPNLVAHQMAKGFRTCLACARARANEWHAKQRGWHFDFHVAADDHYRKIMVTDNYGNALKPVNSLGTLTEG